MQKCNKKQLLQVSLKACQEDNYTKGEKSPFSFKLIKNKIL